MNNKTFCNYCVFFNECKTKCNNYINFKPVYTILPNLEHGSSEKWGVFSWGSTRLLVYYRDKRKCYMCGRSLGYEFETHHIKNRKHGGSNHPRNLITLCDRCHNGTLSTFNERKMKEEIGIKKAMLIWKNLKII